MKILAVDKTTMGGLVVIVVIGAIALVALLSRAGGADTLATSSLLPEADPSQPVTRQVGEDDGSLEENSEVASAANEAQSQDPEPATEGQDVAQVVRDLETKLAETPNDVDVMIELGALYFELQVYPRAADLFSAVLEITPEDAGVRSDLASSFLYQGMIRLARNEYRAAIETDPKLTDAYFNLGISYSHSSPQDIGAAIDAWQRVIELEPESDLAVAAQGFIQEYSDADQATDEQAGSATGP